MFPKNKQIMKTILTGSVAEHLAALQSVCGLENIPKLDNMRKLLRQQIGIIQEQYQLDDADILEMLLQEFLEFSMFRAAMQEQENAQNFVAPEARGVN